MYLARPVQMGQHNLARNTSKSHAPPPPPVAPPPPQLPQKLKPKSKPAPQLAEVKPVFDRDKLLDEVRCGVQLRHTFTNDKSAPAGAGRVRSGGYSPPIDSVASTSAYNCRPDAKKPVFFGKNVENTDLPAAPQAPPPPKAPPPPALLKLGGSTNFDRDKLLNEIHGGVQLRKTVTNDRSAPIGVGTVRNDLSRTVSPVPEIHVSSNSSAHLDVSSSPTPPVPPPPSPDFLSHQMQQNKVIKPITNPALLKLGGKQPIDRDALLASIRGGVKLRKVETNDRSSPFAVSRDTSPDRHTSVEPVMAPPPPPLLVPPPPCVPSAEPIRRSRSPKPALMKLGGKVTVSRDDLLLSIRQGVKLRKTATNDKSSAIINDDDSGVRSPGRSSPSTSNYEDDVYGSQSLSDLSSIGTSRFSSLSNIPPEKTNDVYFASPAPVVSENGVRALDSSSSTKLPINRLPLINVSTDVTNYGDEDDQEVEAVISQTPLKRQADECYSSPIPTRKQIESEIPVGSARDRIKMFGDAERETLHSPVPSLNKFKKLHGEVDSHESGVSRTRKLLSDTALEQSSEEHKQTPVVSNESSIRRMVRKFSTDEDSSKASQPVWCQKKEEKITQDEKKKSPQTEGKTSATKSTVKKKSPAKGSKVKRKPSIKNEQPTTMSQKTYAAPTKPEELSPEESNEVKNETREKNKKTVPKVDISKFRERFENPPETTLTTEETVKPGRVKKPPWIKEVESESSPSLPLSHKTEEAPRLSWKTNTKSDVQKNSVGETTIKKQKSSDHDESISSKSDTAGITEKNASGSKAKDKVSSGSSSFSKVSKKDLPKSEEESTVPTREGVGPYRYTRKISGTDKKPVNKKNSSGSKDASTISSGNLLNSVPKPYGTNLSTTGHTTTIGVDGDKGSETKQTNRHFIFKNKVPSKVATNPECNGDNKKTTSAKTKTASEKNDNNIHYANIGVAVTKIYAVPFDNALWNYPDDGHSMSSSSPSSSSSLNNGNLSGNYLSSTTVRDKYLDSLRQQHTYKQHQQGELSVLSRECNGIIGRARRVVVGKSDSRVTEITKNFQQRSFDDNVSIVYQQQQQQQKLEQQQEQNFFRNYCFQINLENDQQPLHIVHR